MSRSFDKVEVKITFDLNTEEVVVDSGFMNFKNEFKEPEQYTSRLLQMALVKWIKEYIGIVCPECDLKFEKEWTHCPQCGWTTTME